MQPRIAMSLVLVACSIGTGHAAGYPEFEAPSLKIGRGIWLGTCEACHGNPLSEAPQAKNPAAWESRLAKGRAALLANARNGFTGKTGEEMPPRGGNPNLSDAEVEAALEYMLKLIALSKGEMK